MNIEKYKYYDCDNITIYHGNTIEIASSIEADVVLTDTPYGNNTNYSIYNDTKENLISLIPSIFSIKAPRKVITCGVTNIYLFPQPTWILSWTTPAGTGSGPWGFCCWQPILVYGKCPYLQARMGRRSDIFIHTERSKKGIHPCPKPIRFWKKLLQRVSVNPSDIILDPFMGSGITLLAAKELGHRAIGVEIEEKYCEEAAKRLNQGVFSFLK